MWSACNDISSGKTENGLSGLLTIGIEAMVDDGGLLKMETRALHVERERVGLGVLQTILLGHVLRKELSKKQSDGGGKI